MACQKRTAVKVVPCDYASKKVYSALFGRFRFSNQKMLLENNENLHKFFVYGMIDAICFPTEELKMRYDKYSVIKCYMYLNLTDTGSCLCFFNFICRKECHIKEIESRNLNFEILKQSKIAERLDISHPFWSQFEIRDKNVRKQMAL